MQSTILKKNNSERPIDALALKKVNHWLSDNLKSRDASASKNVFHLFLNDQIDNGQVRLVFVSAICYLYCLPVVCIVLYLYFVFIFE